MKDFSLRFVNVRMLKHTLELWEKITNLFCTQMLVAFPVPFLCTIDIVFVDKLVFFIINNCYISLLSLFDVTNLDGSKYFQIFEYVLDLLMLMGVEAYVTYVFPGMISSTHLNQNFNTGRKCSKG